MSKRSLFAPLVGCLLLSLLAAAAPGQTTGRIEGRALDAAGGPLLGVTVAATGPRLKGERATVTDAEGRFRLLALPPGDYTVTAALDGFNPLEVAGIRVALDRTLTLEFELAEDFGSEMTVSGKAPVIDRTGTTTGAEFPEEVFTELPLTREFIGMAFLAPGVTITTEPGGPEMDLSPSIRGASGAANRYILDGLDVTDVALGTLSTGMAFEFVQELEVKTGAYQPEYGGALGGIVNVITKSGGNDLRGDLFGYYTDDGLQASSPETEEFGRFLGETEYDFGFDVGGRISEDKLWYFVAVNPTSTERRLATRQEIELDLDQERLLWAGKLSWQIDPSQHFVASLFGDEVEGPPRFELNAAGRVTHPIDIPALSLSLSYSSTLSPRTLLEINGGHYEQPWDFGRAESGPLYEDRSGTGFWARQQNCGDPDLLDGNGIFFAVGCSGGIVEGFFDPTRDELRASVSHFTGKHQLKGGIHYREMEFGEGIQRPAPTNGPLVDTNGVVVASEGVTGSLFQLEPGFYTLQEIAQDSRGETDELSLFFQDQWRVTRNLTLNLGVRLDSFESTGGFGDRELSFDFEDMIGPRVGFAWDVARNGRYRLSGHYGRFYEAVPLSLNTSNLGLFEFNLYLFLYPEDGSLPTYDNLGTFLFPFFLDLEQGVDPGIEPMHTDEWVLGFHYELRSDLTVGAAVVFRELGNVIEDISLDGGSTFILANPGGRFTADPTTGEPLPEPVVYPRAVRDYQALELTLNKRLNDDWQLFASYVYSENEGNYTGLGDSPHFSPQFNNPESLEGGFGPLPNDRTHHFKVYGSYFWPFGLSTGFVVESLSGTPISKLGVTPFGNDRFVTQRGSAGRVSDFQHLDLRLEYPIAMPKDFELRLIADVFNLTNEQSAVVVDETWTFARAPAGLNPGECGGPNTGPGTACAEGNPSWGSAIEFQQPRTLRLGLKLSW